MSENGEFTQDRFADRDPNHDDGDFNDSPFFHGDIGPEGDTVSDPRTESAYGEVDPS